MSHIDCLVIGSAEHERARERETFLNMHRDQQGDGWGRFLTLNYVEFEDDALLASQLGSLAHQANQGPLVKRDGFYQFSDLSKMSPWRTPLLGGMFVYQYLKSHGFEPALVQHFQLQQDQLDAMLAQHPKVIGISTTLITSPLEMRSIISYCRKRSPDSFIVLGGMSVWNQYQIKKADFEMEQAERAQRGVVVANDGYGLGDVMSGFGFLGADALVVDPYGVETLGKIVGRVRAGEPVGLIPNTVMFESGRAVGPLDRQGEEFDPVKMRMNWDLVEDEHIGNIVNIRTQISCPFRCSFCSYPTTQGPVIKAEIEMFERELQTLQRRGVDRLMIIDDTFNVPPNRFIEILKVLRKYDFEWYSFIRCQFLKPEHVRLMREAGCRGVYLGLESVDDETLKRMNKMAKRDSFKKGVEMLAANDIEMQASFIVGFPGDTPDTVVGIRDFINETGLDYYNLKLFWYDSATPIGKRAKEFGLTGTGYNWQHDTMNSVEATKLIKEMIVGTTNSHYVALHGGELWEVGQFGALGLERRHVDAVYGAHNAMLKLDLAGSGHAAEKQQIFGRLKTQLAGLTLRPSPW